MVQARRSQGEKARAALRTSLLAWYDRHRRDLPWRRSSDPYRIWVAEVMLQQTTVRTVTPYYQSFLLRFPTLPSLAEEPEEEVLATWSGLGYYHRARNLHRGAQHVAERHGGRFPTTIEAALAVPGVGLYTASAILSIAGERPDAEVHATDMSEAALEVALENQRRLGLGHRTFFHRGQLLEPVTGLEGQLEVHLVVSNPPYVDAAEIEGLEPEVRDHEPREALVPPGDALSVYRTLVPAAARALREGGALAVEVSPFISDAVSALMREAGFEAVTVRPDLAGRPRVVASSRGRSSATRGT